MPFLDHSLSFLNLPLPSHCLSLTFHCPTSTAAAAAADVATMTGTPLDWLNYGLLAEIRGDLPTALGRYGKAAAAGPVEHQRVLIIVRPNGAFVSLPFAAFPHWQCWPLVFSAGHSLTKELRTQAAQARCLQAGGNLTAAAAAHRALYRLRRGSSWHHGTSCDSAATDGSHDRSCVSARVEHSDAEAAMLSEWAAAAATRRVKVGLLHAHRASPSFVDTVVVAGVCTAVEARAVQVALGCAVSRPPGTPNQLISLVFFMS